MATPLGEGDDAFLCELLALLGGVDDGEFAVNEALNVAADAAQFPSFSGRPKRKRSASELSGAKRLIASLQSEASQLTEQLERLRRVAPGGSSAAKERALVERRKRHRAEDERQALRLAVARQTQFIRGLRSVVSVSQRLSVGLDLCRYLHRHTRLARHQASRWDRFNARSYETRMETAMDILCQETASITLEDNSTVRVEPSATPLVHCELIDDVNCRSTTYTTVYTLDTLDVAAVVRAVCVAIRDVVTICPSGHPLTVSRDVIDAAAPADHNLLYRVMRVRHRCETSGEEILVASQIVTSYRLTDDYGLVVWDYVDDDELHPTAETVNLTRETTGACLVRRERGEDGVERVVLRSLGTKKFRFQNACAVEKHGRIGCIVQADAMVRGDELLFRRLVLQQLDAEQALYQCIAQV